MSSQSEFEGEVKKITKWAFENYSPVELAKMYARMALSTGECVNSLMEMRELRERNMTIEGNKKTIIRETLNKSTPTKASAL